MLDKTCILSLFPTCLINPINYEHSCKILYICNKGSTHVRSSIYPFIWASSPENLILLPVTKEGTDQPALQPADQYLC